MRSTLLVAAAFALGVAPAHAETPADFEAAFAAEARSADPAFAGFSAARGEQFFGATHGGDWSCASCHTKDPGAAGEGERRNRCARLRLGGGVGRGLYGDEEGFVGDIKRERAARR